AMLATRRYGFVWETTILGSETFIALTHLLGGLPSLLGFGQPDAELIRASGDSLQLDESARHSWAGWLLGVVLVYGLLPRLALALLCGWRWRRGRSRLQLEVQLPGYQLLSARLQPDSERLGVSDAAPGFLHQAHAGVHSLSGQGALLVAVGLDDRHPWPPPLAATVTYVGIVDTREQRRQIRDRLSRSPPQRLVIACDPRRSPDRGSMALLAELSRYAAATRVWLLPPPPGETLDAARLGDWHQGLERLGLSWSDDEALDWLADDD